MIANIEELKPRLKETWMAGNFGEIARSIEEHARDLVTCLDIRSGMRVLDVACGTGNVAILAAVAGASVTGVDIATNLLEQARVRADREGVDVAFDEGDAEALPYADASFDLVVSMYGAMFAPRPERTGAELLRVCSAGGRIVMANWPSDSFIGQMGKVHAAHVPPPSGVPSPVLWGDETTVRERLQHGVSELRTKRVPVAFNYPFSPAETVEFYREYYGPTQRAFESLPPDRQSVLRRDLENHWEKHNRATDGTTLVETEYLEVVATRS